MNAEYADFKHKDITGKIIRAALNVHKALGFGFAEKVYENALVVELESLGLATEQQARVQVFYGDHQVGDYFADLMVEGKVIVELKAVRELDPEHEVQLVNYLRATRLEVGLLLNFARKLEFKRKVFSNL